MAKATGKKKPATENKQKTSASKPVKVPKPRGAVPDYTKRVCGPSLEEFVSMAYAKASPQLDRAFGGFEGIYGIKVPADAVNATEGILIIEVVKQGVVSVMFVRESTVLGISAKNDLYLPTSTLRHWEIKNFIGDEKAFAWQQNLHKVLKPIAEDVANEVRKALHKHLDQMRKQGAREFVALAIERAASVKTEAAEKNAVVEVDVSGAVDLSTVTFLHGKKDASRLYVHRDANNQEVYFHAEVMGGNQTLTLLIADEGHEMYKVFASQEALVRVHVLDLQTDTRPYGDLKEMRNARECMRQYLKNLALSLGLKPKRKAENEEMRAA